MDENAEDFDQLGFTHAREQHLEADVCEPTACDIRSLHLANSVLIAAQETDNDSALGSDAYAPLSQSDSVNHPTNAASQAEHHDLSERVDLELPEGARQDVSWSGVLTFSLAVSGDSESADSVCPAYKDGRYVFPNDDVSLSAQCHLAIVC